MPAIYCNSIDNIVWHKIPADSIVLSTGIDIWRIPVSPDPQIIERFRTVLHPDEVERSIRYHQEKDRQRFITSRATLRFLLGKYLNQSPGDIQLSIGKNKKPFVENTSEIDLHYNVAHSGDWILIAIANSDIGVDIEKIDQHFVYQDILYQSFSDNEINSIQDSVSPTLSFYLYWTRKEALTKATAKGIDDNLVTVPSLDGLHTVSAEIAGTVALWMVSSFQIEKQYVGSVAYNPIGQNIRLLELNT